MFIFISYLLVVFVLDIIILQDFYVAEEVIAAVLGDTSLEAWAPDGEDSYSSTTDSEDVGKTDFWTCAQCKSKNNNPRYRLCEKCFQVSLWTIKLVRLPSFYWLYFWEIRFDTLIAHRESWKYDYALIHVSTWIHSVTFVFRRNDFLTVLFVI